ncbi:MAG TPA: TonB C-terminal domain-containing protein [Polyangiaceae bacterium]|nr:TonB C-terminal domain-containing protein [Polyangiaceae bacterium]
MKPAAFSPGQVVGALSLASLVQAGMVLSMVLARVTGDETLRREPPPREMRIAVNPILDAPLLKKGTQAPAATPPKLPDMWKPPEPVQPRAESKAVPTPQPKKPSDTADPKPTKPQEKPAPETPQERRIDDMVKRMQREAEEQDGPSSTERGGEDGVKEGTETDPLKARAVDQYSAKLIAWFRQGFSAPVDEIECETLVGLEAKVTARIGPNREVLSYTMKSSGNQIFDERVRAAMEMHVGQSVPPPPPNYPQLLEPTVFPTFQGKNERCK